MNRIVFIQKNSKALLCKLSIILLITFSLNPLLFANLGTWVYGESATHFLGSVEIAPPAGGAATRSSGVAGDTEEGVASVHWIVQADYVAADGDGVINDIAIHLNGPPTTVHVTSPHGGGEAMNNGILTRNLVFRNIPGTDPLPATHLLDTRMHAGHWDSIEAFLHQPAPGGPIYLYVWCRHTDANIVPGDSCMAQVSVIPPADLISPFDGETEVSLNPFFTWSPVSGAQAYEVQISEDPLFNPKEFAAFILTENANQFILEGNKNYHWRVRALTSHCIEEPYSTSFSFSTINFPYCPIANGIEHCPIGDVDIFPDPNGPVTLIPFNPSQPSGVQFGIADFEGFAFSLDLSTWWNNPNVFILADGSSEIDFPEEGPAQFTLQLNMLLDGNGSDPVIDFTINPVNPQDQHLQGFVVHHFLVDPQQANCVPADYGSFFIAGNMVSLNTDVVPGAEPNEVNVKLFGDGSLSLFFPQPVDFSGTESSFLANGMYYQPLYDTEYPLDIIAHEYAHMMQLSLTTQNMGDLTINNEQVMFSDHFVSGSPDVLLGNEGNDLIVGVNPAPPVEGLRRLKIGLDASVKVEFCLDRDSMPQPFGDSLIARVNNIVPGGSMDLVIRKTIGPNKLLRVDFSGSGSTQTIIQTFNGGIQQSEDNNADPAFWISLISEDPDKIIAGIDQNTGEFYYECIWNNPITIQINEGPTVVIDKIRIQDVNGNPPLPISNAELEMKGEGNLKLEKITSCRSARVIGAAPFEGPYDPANGMMDNEKAFDGLLPDADPFGLGENMFPGIDPTGQNGPDAIVDWIRVDLRDPDNPDSILHSKAGFVRRDGLMVDAFGVPGIRFPGIEQRGYMPSVNGAGHLINPSIQGIIISPFGNSCGEVFIFYSSAGSSTNSSPGGPGSPGNPGGNLVSGKPGPVSNLGKTLVNGVWVITSGDTNNDGVIDSADRSETWNFRNQSGYLNQDVNWDGVVDSADRSMIWNNRNQSSPLPGN